MKEKNIFFDLDGTLLDSRERLYNLFQDLVPDSGLSFNDYWNLKRNKISHKEILTTRFSYSLDAFKMFEQTWLRKIELPEWLSLDKPFEGVTDFLENLSKTHSLYLVTARQFKDQAFQQVSQYGWQHIFNEVYVTNGVQDKFELIAGSVKTNAVDWFVGDTGKDIQTGKKLGMKTAAVCSGFLSKEKLLEYKPDLIASSVTELNFSA
jgi:phosphoglycolate phosphatase